jgi:hypothetical protein
MTAPEPGATVRHRYAACFQSALLGVAEGRKLDATGSQIRSRVGIGPLDAGGFGLQVSLEPTHLRPSQASSFEPVPVRPQRLAVRALRSQLEHLPLLDHL